MIKDNINVVNLSTTVAYSTFTRERATENSSVIVKLVQTNVIFISKINMDQFPMDLVGNTFTI